MIGGALALSFRIGRRTLSLIMAFGAGVPISVAFELVEDAAETSGGRGGVRSVNGEETVD